MGNLHRFGCFKLLGFGSRGEKWVFLDPSYLSKFWKLNGSQKVNIFLQERNVHIPTALGRHYFRHQGDQI